MGATRSDSIRAQLRLLIEAGDDADAAARQVLAPYGSPDGEHANPLCEFVWPVVYRAAVDAERALEAEVRELSFGAVGSFEVRKNAQQTLRRTAFRMPDGTRTNWDDLTVEMIDAKLAWLRVTVNSMQGHIHALEMVKKLMEEAQVTRLGDVADWPQLVDMRLSR